MFGLKLFWTRRAQARAAAEAAEQEAARETARAARLARADFWLMQPQWSEPMTGRNDWSAQARTPSRGDD